MSFLDLNQLEFFPIEKSPANKKFHMYQNLDKAIPIKRDNIISLVLYTCVVVKGKMKPIIQISFSLGSVFIGGAMGLRSCMVTQSLTLFLIFRVIFDRASTEWDDTLERLDFGHNSHSSLYSDYVMYVRGKKM